MIWYYLVEYMEKYGKINIIYEDNHILVIEKPINILVQADDSNDIDLLTMLKKYLKEKYNKPGNVYLGLVHRLDRPVGGLMVFAKTSKASSRLSEQVRCRNLKKVYYAVVENNLSKKGTLKDYLVKDNKTNNSYVTNEKLGKEAILNYEVLDSIDNFSLVKIDLVTGRSHQIRVQFSSRGNPLYGDFRYNKNVKDGSQIALFAKELSFTHPTTKEVLHFSIDLPNRYPYTLFGGK